MADDQKAPTGAAANTGGRPTKYTPEACAVVLRLGAEGASRAEWAAELDICFKTLRNWEDANPDFLQATTRARQLSQAWWEKQGRKGVWSREFNAAAYKLQVMNRFPADWRDKKDHELTGAGGAPLAVSVTRTVVRPDGDDP